MAGVPKIQNEAAGGGGVGTPGQLNFMQFLIGAVVVVLLIGLVGALVAVGIGWEASTAAKQATYEDLKNQILRQGIEIEHLTKIICSLGKNPNCP